MDRDLLLRLPKPELHVHLDGSIRPQTLLELAAEMGMELPSGTVDGLYETVYKETYEDLKDYLRSFRYSYLVMRDPESIERVSYELAVDNQREGVRYVEVRFAPQLHLGGGMDYIDVFGAVSRGMDRAKREFNRRPEVEGGSEPPFEYGIIACSLRYFDEELSDYHGSFLKLHRHTDPDTIFGLASLELVGAAARARDQYGLPVVGVDLAGAEAGYPAAHHREAFAKAQRCFLKKTVHAGEAYGPESIFQAITDLNADRIGHGTSLFNAGAVSDPTIKDREAYVEALAQYIADRRITVEVCLTSNMQITPSMEDLKDHPFGRMMEHRISVALCTDNRTVSRTTVTDELLRAVRTFRLDLEDLKNVLVYGFKRSFYPGRYSEKRSYVRKCIDHIEKLIEPVMGGGRGQRF
ncbi:adenosine deaminase family protein [Candidatus Fermentibacteria bacterium]|nr:adenosine deaminase family protein [Candidatus Fermentibacteria bacterium]